MTEHLKEIFYAGPGTEPPDPPVWFRPALEDRPAVGTDISGTLDALMGHYVVDTLRCDQQGFEETIRQAVGIVDAEIEGYSVADLPRQRDLSVKFHWGHDHDFGAFAMSGRMGRRHVQVLANFMGEFGIPAEAFRCDVLDVGCWTGGTTLLLAALSAHVTAVEEVVKYARMTRFLLDSFGVPATVLETSLYGLNVREAFDLVYVPGVVYHLSDPLVGLRILANALRIGGSILVESEGINTTGSYCRYEGSAVFNCGSADDLSRGGWNWFCPSPLALARMLWAAGFDEARVRVIKGRIYAVAQKRGNRPITRAGLSRPDLF